MKKKKLDINKINWVCVKCGRKYGECVKDHIATFHVGKCDVCGSKTSVTEPRDFGYLRNLNTLV